VWNSFSLPSALVSLIATRCALCCVSCAHSLDGSRFGNCASFIRHCCAGNLLPILLYSAVSHMPRVRLITCRDIQRGEELTIGHDPQDCAKHQMQLHAPVYINLYAA
jgi:hypothetical protein